MGRNRKKQEETENKQEKHDLKKEDTGKLGRSGKKGDKTGKKETERNGPKQEETRN